MTANDATVRIRELEPEAHFTDLPTRKVDEDLGDHLAKYIGDTFIDWHKLPPCEQWKQIVKALRCHGLTIKESGLPIQDGEAVSGPMVLFINQLFLCTQSFLNYVQDGSIKGRYQVEGILDFLDHGIDEFGGSEFSFNMIYNSDLECMVLGSIDGSIEDPDSGKTYAWRWESPNV